MATRAYDVPLPGGFGKLYESYSNTSQSSPKVNGKLKLVANPHSFRHSRVTLWTNVNPNAYQCQGAEANPGFPWSSSEYNEVYSKFIGKLRSGSGSLGVSLASWGQTRSMIVDRLGKIDRIFRGVERRRASRRRRYDSRQLASDFLEGEFGWLPLLGDIHALAFTIAGKNAIPRQWVKSSSSFDATRLVKVSGFPEITSSFSGKSRLTIAAGVDISNPNLWLLNRMGLINPAVVAWDLVPWSFVVNMFVNVNQVLGSFTDTVGLALTNASVTRSSSVLMEQVTYTKQGANEAYYNHSNVLCKLRTREAGPVPRPSLQFRLPRANFELMAIASALVRQRVGGIR
jgi:hypothetical protein